MFELTFRSWAFSAKHSLAGGKQNAVLLTNYKNFISNLRRKVLQISRNPKPHVINEKTCSRLQTFGTVSAGILLSYSVIKRQVLTLECKTKTRSRNRLVGLDKEQTDDVAFDWKQFGRLLWDDIFSLALAIVVSKYRLRVTSIIGQQFYHKLI